MQYSFVHSGVRSWWPQFKGHLAQGDLSPRTIHALLHSTQILFDWGYRCRTPLPLVCTVILLLSLAGHWASSPSQKPFPGALRSCVLPEYSLEIKALLWRWKFNVDGSPLRETTERAWIFHIFIKKTPEHESCITVWKGLDLQTQSMSLHICWMGTICWYNQGLYFFFLLCATIINHTRTTLCEIFLWTQTSSELHFSGRRTETHPIDPLFFGTSNTHTTVEREATFSRKPSSVVSRKTGAALHFAWSTINKCASRMLSRANLAG